MQPACRRSGNVRWRTGWQWIQFLVCCKTMEDRTMPRTTLRKQRERLSQLALTLQAAPVSPSSFSHLSSRPLAFSGDPLKTIEYRLSPSGSRTSPAPIPALIRRCQSAFRCSRQGQQHCGHQRSGTGIRKCKPSGAQSLARGSRRIAHDRIGQTAGLPHNGDRSIPQTIELAETARLIARRHEEHIGTGLNAVG